MKAPDFKALSAENAADYALQATPDALESAIGKMNQEQVMAVIQKIDEGNDSKWRKKIRAAIMGLSEKPTLEEAGKVLSIPQIFELLDKLLGIEDKHHWKLSPLLVGISHDTFSKFLQSAGEKEINLLKLDSVTEPVQHHLTLLTHELENTVKYLRNQIESMLLNINKLDVNILGIKDVRDLHSRIGDLSTSLLQLLDRTNTALSIAWNTTRLDLIMSLNAIKDMCQRLITHGIGKKEIRESSGLYNQLTERLFRIYGDPQHPENVESLREVEPAIEGLAKLSVWYLKDYLELGLLPHVDTSIDFDKDISDHNEKEKLFSLARLTLEKLGLYTVNDLKTACIFSKKTLKEFLVLHK